MYKQELIQQEGSTWEAHFVLQALIYNSIRNPNSELMTRPSCGWNVSLNGSTWEAHFVLQALIYKESQFWAYDTALVWVECVSKCQPRPLPNSYAIVSI